MAKKVSFWEGLKPLLINALKGELVKRLLLKLIGTTVGFKAWVISFIAEYAFDKLAKPIILLTFRKGYRVYETIDGHIKIKKVEDAKTKDDYNRAVDSIFS